MHRQIAEEGEAEAKAMADILPFARGEPGRRRLPGRGVGEIVIFPGVRVEYHDLPPAPAGDGGPRGGRRSRAKKLASA